MSPLRAFLDAIHLSSHPYKRIWPLEPSRAKFSKSFLIPYFIEEEFFFVLITCYRNSKAPFWPDLIFAQWNLIKAILGTAA